MQSTIAYFGAGISATGLTAVLAKNSRFAFMNPFVLLGASLVGMIGCQFTDNPLLKHSLWGAFTVSQGLSIASLLNFYAMPIIFNAAAATAVMVGALSFYAYNTPTTNFLNMDSFLLLGLAGLLGVGCVNMFWPSALLMNLYMYGGLMLFGGFVLYDT